ncbi:MAG TPA: MFS transporter [Blastocatellia bacterium]|nr:MFS transporter [Blastocatellia bacterium]
MTHTQTNAHATIEAEPSQNRPMRPFFILWTGQSLSLIGSQAVQFALIWWLTETRGSATILATATLLGLLPPIVLGPVIGALIDRWNRKTVMLAADGFVAVASLLLAWLFSTGIADIPHVLALLFLRALGAAFHSPAMTASTTLMVPEKHLTRIQGVNQSIQGLLTIVAAPLGAALLAIFSMAGVMMVDVGTALLAILPLLAIRVPRPTRSDGLGQSSVWAETVAGFRYLVRRRGQGTLIAMAALINALLVPAFSLLPLLVLQRLNGGAAQFGWLSSSFGVGLIVGGVALGAWGGFRKRIVTTLIAMTALGVAVTAVGLTPASSFLWALVSMSCVGLIVPLVNGPVYAILQATIAPDYQGRVFSLVASLAGAAAPLGLITAAPVAEIVGVGVWYLAGGIACVAMGIAGFFAPAVMGIEDGAAEGIASMRVDEPSGR